MLPPSDMLDGLKLRYGESQRHYHTWDHVEALLAHFHSIEATLFDPEATLWALYWHDAIYDPQKSDNEDQSADLLREEAAGILDSDALDRADTIIRATQQHLVPEGVSAEDRHDLQTFLDIDLSILASDADVFDTYEANIRKEYAFVPEDVYAQARAAILSGFLKRERLYFSDHYHNLWEDRARANLQRSISRLTS
mgnify:CR=1 FL=1